MIEGHIEVYRCLHLDLSFSWANCMYSCLKSCVKQISSSMSVMYILFSELEGKWEKVSKTFFCLYPTVYWHQLLQSQPCSSNERKEGEEKVMETTIDEEKSKGCPICCQEVFASREKSRRKVGEEEEEEHTEAISFFSTLQSSWENKKKMLAKDATSKKDE